MITVANRIYVAREYAEAFEKGFVRERDLWIKCLASFLTRCGARLMKATRISSLPFGNSRQTSSNWVRSDAFLKGHAQSGTMPKEAFVRSNVLEMHEVVQDSSRPDLPVEPHGGPFKMH